LYIIHRGLALYGGRVLRAGMVWGEDSCILHNERLRSPFVARAMTFLECFSIDAADIDNVMPSFPEFAKVVRARAMKLAVRRAFLLEAARVRAENTQARISRARGALQTQTQGWGTQARIATHALEAAKEEVDFSDIASSRTARLQAAEGGKPRRDSRENDDSRAGGRQIEQMATQLSSVIKTIEMMAQQQTEMKREMAKLRSTVLTATGAGGDGGDAESQGWL